MRHSTVDETSRIGVRRSSVAATTICSSNVTHGGRDQAFARAGGRVRGDHRDAGASSRAPTNIRGCRRRVHPSDARFDPGRALPVDRRTDLQEALVDGNTARVLKFDVEDGGRGGTVEGDHMRWDGLVRSAIRAIAHQCGLLGCRVGEASNHGPVQTRQARRLERARWRGLESTQQDPVEESLVRSNSGRHVVPRTSWTVEEPETTVPASPQALIAAGMADADAPPTIVDALGG